MDIKKALELEHTKENTERIVAYIGKNGERFDELMRIFFNSTIRNVQRASWVLGKVGEEQPQLLLPYQQKMIALLVQPTHDAVKRNIVRVFQFIETPEDLHGELIDNCFKLLMDRKQAVAIRAFCITVLDKHCKIYPELMGEFIAVLEAEKDYTTASFKSRAKKILKREMKRS